MNSEKVDAEGRDAISEPFVLWENKKLNLLPLMLLAIAA
jgi:hypothetical protein